MHRTTHPSLLPILFLLSWNLADPSLALLRMASVAAREPQTHGQPETAAVHAPLTVEQVVRSLEQRTKERTQALRHYEGMRVYRLQYRGILGDRDAEMVVKATYRRPLTKDFAVISQSGSKFVIDHIFKKLQEAEREALRPENQEQTTLNNVNYTFALVGYEETPDNARYILSVLPKSKNKFLYQGKIWVDAEDFAIVRIQAEPAKSPSFWVKKSVIEHQYEKVNDFWLPAHSRTETEVRLNGHAVLTIEYKDYQIKEADPLSALGPTKSIN
jgi:hypothetical protein